MKLDSEGEGVPKPSGHSSGANKTDSPDVHGLGK